MKCRISSTARAYTTARSEQPNNGQSATKNRASYVTTPIVGALGAFMYVDSYPDMETWAAAKKALAKEEGQAREAALNELATCETNSLYEREAS